MRTFLAFMEYGWAWMVPTDFFSVCVCLATPLMDAFLGHVGGLRPSSGLGVFNSRVWSRKPRPKVREELAVLPLSPKYVVK